MKKGFLSLLLAVLLTSLSSASSAASADNTYVSLSLVKTGTQFELSLVSESSFTLGGIGLVYSYDSSAFTFVKASSSILSSEANSSIRFISLYSGSEVPVTRGTVLETLTFAVTDGYDSSKEYAFSMYFEEAFDYDDEDIPFTETTAAVSYQEELPAQCEHQWGAWYVTTPATAEENGVESRTCTLCGETETREYVPVRYTVIYNTNGGSAAPSAQKVLAGQVAALADAVPRRDGFLFLGWAKGAEDEAAAYQPGESFTPSADTTLYAVWLDLSAPDFKLPASLERIGDEAFSGTAVRYAALPEGLAEIGSRVFDGCTKLIAVYAPALVTSILSDTFDGAPNTLVLLGQIASAIAEFATQYGFHFEDVSSSSIS